MDRWPTAPSPAASWLFPAHAGMDRVSDAARIRNPPLFPAHAGMDRTEGCRGDGPSTCSPHTRGWTGPRRSVSIALIACSPHTRGWTAMEPLGAWALRLFPAHAGMDRIFGLQRGRAGDCSPHTRGWTESTEGTHHPGYPVPRTRGDGPLAKCAPKQQRGLFPAHAGMDRWPNNWGQWLIACSPHTRGWTDWSQGVDESCGSVPRTRGDGPLRGDVMVITEILFPAHAGMDRDAISCWSQGNCCSPHTRGWTVRALKGRSSGDAVPRTRGDGPARLRVLTPHINCSPHTRGWTDRLHGSLGAL